MTQWPPDSVRDDESAAPARPTQPGDAPGRHLSSSRFLDRREGSRHVRPDTWGWRGTVRRWSGGAIRPRMGPSEVAYENDRAQVRKSLSGPRTIAFVNPKGGAAKTTGVLVSGSVVPYDRLSEATTRCWLRACAAMAAAL